MPYGRTLKGVMKTLVLALGCALAAASHADLTIDGFTDGMVDSGHITNGSPYSSSTPATVAGGVRAVSFTNVMSQFAVGGYQVVVNPGGQINSGASVSTDSGVTGDVPADLRRSGGYEL